MKSDPRYIVFFVVIIIAVFSDLYAYKGLKNFIPETSRFSSIYPYLYWGISFVFIAIFAATMLFSPPRNNVKLFTFFFFLGTLFIMIYLPKLIFSLFHLLDNIVIYGKKTILASPVLTRKMLISKMGIAMSIMVIFLILHGVFIGRFNFKANNLQLKFKNLPSSFDGIRIAQFSDVHIGSFIYNKEPLRRALKMLNKEKPDIIFFTGDLVNEYAEELKEWEDEFSKLSAPLGKYAILGNHDYGDYSTWKSEKDKQENHKKLIDFFRKTGFHLLLNSADIITRDNQQIGIIGVENWGHPPFKQYGNLNKASQLTDSIDFNILLSHDPSHWKAEVQGKKNIPVTLSGHTHGMQFGIETKHVKWSPVKYIYENWAGLYHANGQYLYVNRGLGHIGFMARVGIYPEITIIELQKSY